MVKPRRARGPRGTRRAGGADTEVPAVLPVVSSRDLVPFPSVMTALVVSAISDRKAVEAAVRSSRLLFVAARRTSGPGDGKPEGLYAVGVVAHVVRTISLPGGQEKVLVQGISRARSVRRRSRGGYFVTGVTLLPDLRPRASARETEVRERIRKNLETLVEKEQVPEELLIVAETSDGAGALADLVLAHYRLGTAEAQAALEERDPSKRLRLADELAQDELNRLSVSQTIRDKARDELDKDQREYYLREQIRQIREELGEGDGPAEDLRQLEAAVRSARLPKHAAQETSRQLARLERMPAESSEYALLRTYLEWTADLPWRRKTRDRLDPKAAAKALDREHLGLAKAKDRILEYLSVRKLNPDLAGPILCFVGPPGVGKTSLGRSVAEALGRRFVRMSLGGVRDEAEIRGHRRTYVGALPGRIIQGLRQAGSRNPVFILDELDKLGADFRGDPASALLEVLDPQQNREFRDHYLNLSFDLSDVLFVATANTVDTIPEALSDRLEIIYLSSYTTEEKAEIARRFIVPRQLKENGLTELGMRVTDAALEFLIERYTEEAGVRGLEREIAAVCRKTARELCEKGRAVRFVTPARVRKLLGPTRFDPEAREKRDLVGLARGLAWTVNGGEVMPVEVSVSRGAGSVTLTGQLGNVMQESAHAAVSYARANAKALGLKLDFHQKSDLHVHVPGGSVPKDGPSAGITICCALVSALSERPVSADLAMTGEMTLRGTVLPVGGLKEKALAALRHGLGTIILPAENMKDVDEIPAAQREQMTFIPVRDVGEVLERALLPRPGPPRRARRASARRSSDG